MSKLILMFSTDKNILNSEIYKEITNKNEVTNDEITLYDNIFIQLEEQYNIIN